jgi:hypothetical protein
MRQPGFALVITRLGGRDRILQLPWMGSAFGVEAADWIVLTEESWRALAIGEEKLPSKFERKLIWSCYPQQPRLHRRRRLPGRGW